MAVLCRLCNVVATTVAEREAHDIDPAHVARVQSFRLDLVIAKAVPGYRPCPTTGRY